MKRIIYLVLLSLCLAVTAGSLSASSLQPSTGLRPNAHYQVLIIGAGVSGLAAAQHLAQHQVSVLVLEARDRIGGRIYTINPWGLLNLDLGASWIHGTHNNPIAEMAKQQNISTIPTIYADNAPLQRFNSASLYNSQGKRLTPAQTQALISLVQQFDDLLEKQQKELDKLAVEAAYEQFLLKAHLNKDQKKLLHYLISMLYIYEYAGDLSTLSASSHTAYSGSIVSGANVIFPKGYSQILPQLTKNLPIQLNQRVIKISYGPQGVDVYTEHEHFHADRLILTVPLGVLKAGKIKFSPQLPENKLKSIATLKMGSFNKIYLFFDRPFWDKSSEWIGYIPPSSKQPIDILNYYKYSGRPVLIFFTGGSLAKTIEKWNDQKTLAYLMLILKKIYGENIPKPSAYVITRWNQDPFSKGSYSYLPAGATTEAFKGLAEPVAERLFFAGEATSATDPATVHGAYSSGVRAAKEVLGTFQ